MDKTTTGDKMNTIKMTVTVPLESIECILCTAIEQGISYWAVRVHEGSLGVFKGKEKPYTPYYGNFEHPKWELVITDDYGEAHTLTREKLAKGFNDMQVAQPETMHRLLHGNYDSWDADGLIQFALFGKAIYG